MTEAHTFITLSASNAVFTTIIIFRTVPNTLASFSAPSEMFFMASLFAANNCSSETRLSNHSDILVCCSSNKDCCIASKAPFATNQSFLIVADILDIISSAVPPAPDKAAFKFCKLLVPSSRLLIS